MLEDQANQIQSLKQAISEKEDDISRLTDSQKKDAYYYQDKIDKEINETERQKDKQEDSQKQLAEAEDEIEHLRGELNDLTE